LIGETGVQDDYGAAFLGSAFPSLVDSPAKKLAGFLLAPPDCVLPHVNSLGRDVVSPPRGAFRRVLSGVGAMKAAFKAIFAIALVLGLASTVAANAPLVTAPQVLTSN